MKLVSSFSKKTCFPSVFLLKSVLVKHSPKTKTQRSVPVPKICQNTSFPRPIFSRIEHSAHIKDNLGKKTRIVAYPTQCSLILVGLFCQSKPQSFPLRTGKVKLANRSSAIFNIARS